MILVIIVITVFEKSYLGVIWTFLWVPSHSEYSVILENCDKPLQSVGVVSVLNSNLCAVEEVFSS